MDGVFVLDFLRALPVGRSKNQGVTGDKPVAPVDSDILVGGSSPCFREAAGELLGGVVGRIEALDPV